MPEEAVPGTEGNGSKRFSLIYRRLWPRAANVGCEPNSGMNVGGCSAVACSEPNGESAHTHRRADTNTPHTETRGGVRVRQVGGCLVGGMEMSFLALGGWG